MKRDCMMIVIVSDDTIHLSGRQARVNLNPGILYSIIKSFIMNISVNDTVTLRNIQRTFTNFYPYLKLAFYRAPHKKYEASSEDQMLFPDTTLSSILKTHVSGVFEILPSYRVTDVEQEFQKRFGLSVQVLIKERKQWKQTTGMDDFTLKELNELSRSYSDEYLLDEQEWDLEVGGEG